MGMGGWFLDEASWDRVVMFDITLSAEEVEMSRMMTLLPCLAKSSTAAAPMPSAPPVMRTVLSRRDG